MANWEKKSAYLLREIVKFKTYVDSLKVAQQQKEVIEQEREARASEKAALFADAAAQQQLEASASSAPPEIAEHKRASTTALEVSPPVPPKTAQSA
jgi:hypothetical protein